MSSFSDRLKELRKSKGVTQKAVAEHIGILEQAYQKYEYGKHEPNHETTIRLAEYFGASIDYLLGRVESPSHIIITPRAFELLNDSRLSWDAKGLYMSLNSYTVDDEVILRDKEKFAAGGKVTIQELDDFINELESFGYLKKGDSSDGTRFTLT